MQLSGLNDLPLREAAIRYSLMGFRVFPCRVGGKEPLVQWQKVATSSPATVGLLWDLYPGANIGLAMGDGNLAIDLDVKGGQNGPLSWELAGAPVGRWPVQITPSGGQHVLISGVDSQGLRNITRRGLTGGIDLRTDGGYICVAPSVLPEGRYIWAEGGDLGAAIPDPLLTQLVSWSERSARRGAFPALDEEPSQLNPQDCLCIAHNLGNPYTRFLLEGTSWSGDTSKDAYAVARTIFKRGWSLGDLREIAANTYLGIFGGQPPHGASDPLGWFMRYTGRSAYQDHRAELEAMFGPTKEKAPDEGALKDNTEEERNDRFGPVGDSIWDELGVVNPQLTDPNPLQPNPALSTEDLYKLFQGRASTLPSGDFLAAEHWAKEVLSAGLPDYYIQGLLGAAKAASGITLGVLNQMVAGLRKGVAAPVAPTEPSEIFVRSQDRFYDRRGGAWITKGGMASAKARDHQGDPNAALDYYLHGAGAVCLVVDDVTYDPGADPGVTVDSRGVSVFNKYRPTSRVPLAGDTQPWFDVLAALAFAGGQTVTDRLVDELAWIVQNPGQKMNHGIVLGGAEGVGKDSLLAPIIEAIGQHNVQIVNGEALSSPFQSYLANTKAVVFNEVRMGSWSDRQKMAERLKPILAAPPKRLDVNEKNLRPYSIPNIVQAFLQTNHRDGLHIDPGSRRYFCLWAEAVIPEDPEARERWNEHFSRYWHWLEQEQGYEKVYAMLLRRDVAHINPMARPVITAWQVEMSNQAVDPLTSWIQQQLERREGIFGAGEFNGRALTEWVQEKMPMWLRSRPFSELAVWRAVTSAPRNPYQLVRSGKDGPVFRIVYAPAPPEAPRAEKR